MANKCLLIFSLIFLHGVGISFAQSGGTEVNSRYVLTLNESHVEILKSLGLIQSRELNAESQGKISVVQIQFSGGATDQAVVTDTPAVTQGNACEITLTDEIIDLARQQPIRINVPNNATFSRVYLKYNNESSVSGSTEMVDEPMDSISTAGQSVFAEHYVKLSEGSYLKGQIDLSGSVTFETKFGEVEIAVGQIRGIRFHVDGDDAAVVVLKNGDSITGIPQADSFELTTEWGRAELETVHVESITTSQTATFQQTNDSGFGPRWQLLGQ